MIHAIQINKVLLCFALYFGPNSLNGCVSRLSQSVLKEILKLQCQLRGMFTLYSNPSLLELECTYGNNVTHKLFYWHICLGLGLSAESRALKLYFTIVPITKYVNKRTENIENLCKIFKNLQIWFQYTDLARKWFKILSMVWALRHYQKICCSDKPSF